MVYAGVGAIFIDIVELKYGNLEYMELAGQWFYRLELGELLYETTISRPTKAQYTTADQADRACHASKIQELPPVLQPLAAQVYNQWLAKV